MDYEIEQKIQENKNVKKILKKSNQNINQYHNLYDPLNSYNVQKHPRIYVNE